MVFCDARNLSKGADCGRASYCRRAVRHLHVRRYTGTGSYFQLTSPAFSDNGITVKYAGKNPSNPNCIGEITSPPPLQWINPPAGTRSFALIMHDLEGRNGLGVTHWVIYGIDGTAREIGEGSGTLKNVLAQNSYLGACPPPGKDNPLWSMTNVIMTPRIGGMSDRYADQVLPLMTHNLRAFAEGRLNDMKNIV